MTISPMFLSMLSFPLLSVTLATIFIIFINVIKRAAGSSVKLPPGPWALPVIGHLHLLGRQPMLHHVFQRLSARYGPIVQLRFGSTPVVLVSTPELVLEFLKTHELNFSYRKHSEAIDRLTYNSSFALAPYGPYWKYINKLSTVDLLGSKSLGKFRSLRRLEFDRFIKALVAKSDQEVNLTEEFLKLTNNIISQTIFGARTSETERDAEEVRALVREVTQLFGVVNVADFIRVLKWIDMSKMKERVDSAHRKYDKILERVITEREAERSHSRRRGSSEAETEEEEEAVKDLLDILLDVMMNDANPDQMMKITRNQIKALILDYLTAATDTSAITIEWAMAELINNPTVMQTAREEVDRMVGKRRIVEESDLPNLPYIQAVIKETLRLHPPIPVLSRRAFQEVTVAGYTIPEGTLLFINNWAVSRDPKYWDNPLKFSPTRFLVAEMSQKEVPDVKGQHFQVLPFGSGRRGCPGMNLALIQLPTILAAMLQCFNWKLVASNGGVNMVNQQQLVVDMTERPGLTTPRAHDLVCVPTCREFAF